MTIATVQAVQRGTEVLLALSGEVDLANRDEVAGQLNAAISNQSTSVLLDLTETSYLDSAGLGLLFTLAERLRLLQVDFALVVPRTSLSRTVIELSGLNQVVEIHDGEQRP